MTNKFKDSKEVLKYLKSLPRYKNSIAKSAFWRLKFFISIIFCRIFNINKPIFIVLVTNNGCNLNCTYCYGSYGTRKTKDFTTKELVEIIDELKKLGTINLTIHGGESLLRKDIGEILNYAKLKGFYITFNTNGYYVPSKINEIKCVDNVTISLDGREENNDINRGKGCFQKVMKAIEAVKNNNLPCVLHATVTKQTLNDIEYLAKFAKDKSLRLQYSLLYNTGDLMSCSSSNSPTSDDAGKSNILVSDDEARQATQTMLDLRKKGYPIYYSDNVLEAAISWPEKYNERHFYSKSKLRKVKDYGFIKCYHGSLKYQIDADGRVVTCWGHNKPDAPNIREFGVKGAIEKCSKDDDCGCCVFLANNEHNALIDLGFKNIWNISKIQLADVLKISNKNSNS